MTMSQMSMNKKAKTEQEFEEMFMKVPPKTLGNRKVENYRVVETRMKDPPKQAKPIEKWVKKPIDYVDHDSLIPGRSEGHYSFEESRLSSHAQPRSHHQST